MQLSCRQCSCCHHLFSTGCQEYLLRLSTKKQGFGIWIGHLWHQYALYIYISIDIYIYIYITNVWCIATTTMSREQRRWKHGISWKFNRSLRNELKFNDFNGISTFFDISRCLCCQVFLNVDPIDPLRFQAAKLKQSKLCVGVSRFVEILRTPKKLYIIW